MSGDVIILWPNPSKTHEKTQYNSVKKKKLHDGWNVKRSSGRRTVRSGGTWRSTSKLIAVAPQIWISIAITKWSDPSPTQRNTPPSIGQDASECWRALKPVQPGPREKKRIRKPKYEEKTRYLSLRVVKKNTMGGSHRDRSTSDTSPSQISDVGTDSLLTAALKLPR